MTPSPLELVCAAAREQGMHYGDYVTAGMPGYAEYCKRVLGDDMPAAPPSRVCEFCGDPLPANSSDRQKYCSKNCSDKAGYYRRKGNNPKPAEVKDPVLQAAERKAKRAAYYQANKETIKARSLAWQKANPDRRKEQRLRSTAKKRAKKTAGGITSTDQMPKPTKED